MLRVPQGLGPYMASRTMVSSLLDMVRKALAFPRQNVASFQIAYAVVAIVEH